MNNSDNTNRFSNRVENYVKYRPGYPLEIIDFLKNECALSGKTIIADIGSGTGISAKLFLNNGNIVYGVEPNKEMREAAENFLKEYPEFISINGTAENTTLESNSVDMIISGQAFHWFDKQECKSEFKRIIKREGYVILFWNEKTESNDFMKSYYDLLKIYGTDYEKVNHSTNTDDIVIDKFYSPYGFNKKIFDYRQSLDYKGLEGRLLSSSYIPLEGENHDKMIRDLKNMFEKYNVNGEIAMEYDTLVYYGKLQM
ncbi:MAG: class I SAM-dependent methyltransferase [Ignavibacteria bacterium]|nr:class I SAM-dependent methyltransferase [Ignavibacteria bacterium]